MVRKKKSPTTLEDIKRWQDEAVQKWIAENGSKEQVERHVFEMLESRRDDLIAKLAGFENRWGDRGWEIDHCNGRESAVTDFIRHNAGTAVQAWLKETVANISNVRLSPRAIKRVEAEYRDRLWDRMDDLIKERVEETAGATLDTILARQGLSLALPMTDTENEGADADA